MPKNIRIELTEEELEELRDILSEAMTEYGVEKVMPQTEEVLEQFPGINPMGHYSEIDMGITERMKRCEYASRMRDPLAWEVYQDVKEKIEKTYEYADMRAKMLEISKKVNVIDRAIRMCDNENLVEYLEAQKEELKQDPVLEEYDKFLDIMEHYSGVKFFGNEQQEEQHEMFAYLKEKYDVTSANTLRYIVHGQILNFSNPRSIEIEFENFDNMVTFQRLLDDQNLGKQLEEIEAEPVEPSDMKRYVSTIPAYIEASCNRALDAALPDVKDRADMLFIDGRSVREMMKQEEEFKKKEPTEDEIRRYSNLYVASALRNGVYVEAFTKDHKGINYKPVPITAKGENSYILKNGGTKEIEKITISFLDRFLAMIGLKHFKEKIKAAEKAAELAERLEPVREAFRTAHADEMKIAMSKEDIKDRNQAFKSLHKCKDHFLTVHENTSNYNAMIDTLDSHFFPEGKNDIVNKATGTVVPNERERVRTLAIAYMLKEGFSLEQILDTSTYRQEREQCAQALREHLENCDEKTFFKTIFDSQTFLKDKIEEYAAKHNLSFNNPERIWESPTLYLMDIALGLGNMTDFLLGSKLKGKMVELFGQELVEESDKLSRNAMVIGTLPKDVGKYESIYCILAEGIVPKDTTSDILNHAIKAEVMTKIVAAFEKPGQIFSPDVDVIQVDYIYNMVMAHPNTEKYLKNSSNEKIMEVIAQGNILKELKVDFEILDEKKMPGKTLESETFKVSIEMGDPLSAVKVVPTFNGSSAYYEMDDPDIVMEKAEELEKSSMGMS